MEQRLDTEVWALDRCAGCGNCVALCSKGVLHWGSDEHPAREQRTKALGLSQTTLDTCTFCQRFCEEGCPRLEAEWHALPVRKVASVRATGIVDSGEPGDVLRSLLVAALSAGLIDGAVVGDLDRWTLQPVARVATTVGEVVEALGTPYLWTPVLSALNEAVFEQRLHNLAVVGTPCVSQALRKLGASANTRLAPYQRAVRLTIAAFCTGVYRSELLSDSMGGGLGIDPRSIKRLEMSPRDNRLTATLWDGSQRAVPMSRVEKYTRRGCARCDDYMGESADIAIGSVGARPGSCTLIARTSMGEILLHASVDLGLLEVSEQVDQVALARAGAEKERRLRAQQFDQLMLMMLDALAEPRKASEARQAFVRLYERRDVEERRTASGEDAACTGCTQC
jgi:coenzyme F420 hydrogenase subunit beta